MLICLFSICNSDGSHTLVCKIADIALDIASGDVFPIPTTAAKGDMLVSSIAFLTK